jgi:DNA-directed RNA polymerase specialized sigma24 family protein
VPPHARLVADPRIEQALRRWLRGRVPAAEVDDLVQDVLEALLRHAQPPDTVNGLIALGRQILRNDLTDYYRHREVVRDVEAGPREQRHDDSIGPPAAAEAWDPVDVQKRARWLESFVARGKVSEDDLRLLERANTESYVALAQEFGTSEQALRVRVHRKRAFLQAGWARYVALGVPGLAVVILIVYALVHRKDEIAHEITPDIEAPYPPSPRERAAALRQVASRACAAAQWSDCLDKLDKARELDPAGDKDPNVEDLRDQADQALHPAPVEPHRQDKPQMK